MVRMTVLNMRMDLEASLLGDDKRDDRDATPVAVPAAPGFGLAPGAAVGTSKPPPGGCKIFYYFDF